jgi:hypothetical protein
VAGGFNPLASPNHPSYPSHRAPSPSMISSPAPPSTPGTTSNSYYPLTSSEKVLIHRDGMGGGGGGGSGKRHSNPNNDAIIPLVHEDFLAIHFNEFTAAAENALKTGFRSLAVPILNQKLSKFVNSRSGSRGAGGEEESSHQVNEDGRRESRLHNKPSTAGNYRFPSTSISASASSSSSAQSHNTPNKAKKFSEKLIKTFLESNIFDGLEGNTNNDDLLTTSTLLPSFMNLSDPKVLYHLIDLEYAKDIFSSLSSYLINSSSSSVILPIEQQEIALNLFYQVSEKIEKVATITFLPVVIQQVLPLPLADPLKPYKVYESNKILKDFYSFINEQHELAVQSARNAVNGKEEGESNKSIPPPAPSELDLNPTFRFLLGFNKNKKTVNGPLIQSTVDWFKDDICYLIVLVKNPFSIPIQFTSISPIIGDNPEEGEGVGEGEGDTEEVKKKTKKQQKRYSFPSSFPVTIPPDCEKFEIYLPIKVLSKGTLIINGVQLRMGNFIQEILINKKGFPRKEGKALADEEEEERVKKDFNSSKQSSGVVVVADSLGSSSFIETNEVQIIEHSYDIIEARLSDMKKDETHVQDDQPKEMEEMQCYVSWEANPLIHLNGPTLHHKEVHPIELSLIDGEIRKEKLWLQLPTSISSNDLVQVFQVTVHECYPSTSSASSASSNSTTDETKRIKRSVLLKDYFNPVTVDILSSSIIRGISVSSCSSSSSIVNNQLYEFSIEFQLKSLSSSTSATSTNSMLTLVPSIDLEIHVLPIRKQLYNSILLYQTSEKNTTNDWISHFPEKEELLSELSLLQSNKLLLHFNISYDHRIQSKQLQVISYESEYQLQQRKVLLKDWQFLNERKLSQIIPNHHHHHHHHHHHLTTTDNSGKSIFGKPLHSQEEGEGGMEEEENEIEDERNHQKLMKLPNMIVFNDRVNFQFTVTTFSF